MNNIINILFDFVVIAPFIGLLWIAFITLLYLFIQFIKGDF